MEEIEKLRILLPHWIEHNKEHAAEFREWAERARAAGQADAAKDLHAAANSLDQASEALASAMKMLGGPVVRHEHFT